MKIIKLKSKKSFWGFLILNYCLISFWIISLHLNASDYSGLARELIIILIACIGFSSIFFGGDSISIAPNSIICQTRMWVIKRSIHINNITKIEKEFVNLGYTKFNLYSIFYKDNGKIKRLRLGTYTYKESEAFIKEILDINTGIVLVGF